MQLKLPEVTSKYYARQIVEAMLESDELKIFKRNMANASGVEITESREIRLTKAENGGVK